MADWTVGTEPEVIAEARRQLAAGNSIALRDRYCCTWFRAGVKSARGEWLGQINVHGEFIPNLTTKDNPND